MVSATPILEPGYVSDPADVVLDADFRDLSPRLSAAEQALTEACLVQDRGLSLRGLRLPGNAAGLALPRPENPARRLRAVSLAGAAPPCLPRRGPGICRPRRGPDFCDQGSVGTAGLGRGRHELPFLVPQARRLRFQRACRRMPRVF